MIATTTDASAVPLPWRAFYELGRQICIGFAVTFGSRPVHPLTQRNKMKNDALQIRLVLISEGEETVPVTRVLPGTAFEPHALAARLADAIAEGVATAGRSGFHVPR
jgi:hypothetical protein